MHKLLAALAVFGIATAPAVAQNTPPAQAAPVQKPKTVTKVVCERIEVEETTGSRLGSAPKKCRRIEVPAGKDAQKAQSHGHSGHAH